MVIDHFADFLFPDGTPQERMIVRGDHEVKVFCKDNVEKAEIMFIIATAACVLVILSLVRLIVSSLLSQH